MIVVIDADQGLLLVSLSRMMKTSIISAKTEIHLPKAWEMMQWVEHSTKFLGHLQAQNKGGRLPRQFAQPTFTMYNGQTDPLKHVSHFN